MFLLVLPLLLTTVFNLQAAGRDELERRLKDEFVGKVVTVRNFYVQPNLRYNQSGELFGAGETGPWTLYGKTEITGVRLLADQLVMEGRRIFLEYDKETEQFREVRSGEEIGIQVELNPEGTEGDIRGALRKIFISGAEDFSALVSPYWRCFVLDSLYWKRSLQNRKAPSSCFRPLDAGDAVFSVEPGSGVQPPRLVSRVAPDYTQIARKARVEGTVVLMGVVNKDGDLEALQIVRPLGYGLDEKAVESVRQWKFEPATRNGEPVRVYASIEVTLRLLR